MIHNRRPRIERSNSIGKLRALTHLNLCDNDLNTLPDSIGNLGVLEILELNDNQLSTLPDSIGNLGALTYLNLRDNLLTSLPDSIGNLEELSHLDLTRNPLMGEEQQWAKLLKGNELNSFRNFYKTREILTMKKGGLLLLANQFDSKSILADIPSEIVDYISLLHIYDRLG